MERLGRARISASTGSSRRISRSASKDRPARERRARAEHQVGEELFRRGSILRVHQRGLQHEVELTQRRRRLFRLQDVPFEQEGRIVQELEGDLPVGAQDGAVDEDAVARLQGELHGLAHLNPSLTVRLMSISPVKLWLAPLSSRSASRMTQRPIEMRSVRSGPERLLPGSDRSEIRKPQSCWT